MVCCHGTKMGMQLFGKGVFFRGEDNTDQLFKIGEILGSNSIREYVKRYGLKPDAKIR